MDCFSKFLLIRDYFSQMVLCVEIIISQNVFWKFYLFFYQIQIFQNAKYQVYTHLIWVET